MKRISLFLLAAISVSILSSCVLEQNIHFNEDFSGKYNMKLDMSAFMAMAGDSAATDSTQLSAEDFKEMEDKLKEIEGITNIQSSTEEGIYELKYDFSDLNSLNKTANQTNEESGGILTFTKKGKKLIMTMNPPEDGEEEMSAEDLESMEGMFSFQYNITFDKQVAKIKSKVATLDKESNTVVLRFGLKEFFDKNTNWKTEITLK